MGVAELRRVKQLEEENRRLKQVVADLTLDKAMLQDMLQKGLRPARRREMARELVAAFRVPTRRACAVVGCHRATFYYRARRRDGTPLRMRLRELAAARPRFGYRRLHILLRREGWRINHRRTYRLYRAEQLGVRVRRRHKRASQVRVRPVTPTRPNERWCMDFMADRLDDGRRIRILTVEDVFTRECLAVEVDTSLVSARVVAVLARLVQARGAPRLISVDNGSEFYSRTTDSWAYQAGVQLAFSRPGKPMDNPFHRELQWAPPGRAPQHRAVLLGARRPGQTTGVATRLQ